MSRRVVLSDLARDDLTALSEYLRQRSPPSALRFLDAAKETFALLASMPGLGEPFALEPPLLQGIRRSAVSSRFPSHIIYYRPLDEGIIVLRVVHGSRDTDSLFGDEGGP
jgi:toxin ParE1/3/4